MRKTHQFRKVFGQKKTIHGCFPCATRGPHSLSQCRKTNLQEGEEAQAEPEMSNAFCGTARSDCTTFSSSGERKRKWQWHKIFPDLGKVQPSSFTGIQFFFFPIPRGTLPKASVSLFFWNTSQSLPHGGGGSASLKPRNMSTDHGATAVTKTNTVDKQLHPCGADQNPYEVSFDARCPLMIIFFGSCLVNDFVNSALFLPKRKLAGMMLTNFRPRRPTFDRPFH